MKKFNRASKIKKSTVVLASTTALLLGLAACSGDSGSEGGSTDGGGSTGGDSEETGDDLFSIDDFDVIKGENGEEMIEGGSLNVALVTDTPFEGTLNPNFYQGTFDKQVIDWFNENLLAVDENFTYTQEGAATFEINDDGDVFTFTINENLNWHDGEPVTAEDWVFAFEVLGHPDYPATRFSEASNVQGFNEFRAGDADDISGLNIIDEKTLEITFTEASPSLLASGVWDYPMPKHIFEDIEVADMESSPEVRENPIGYGAFKVESVTPGEAVVYSKNEDYWRGEPNLDEVILSVVNPQTISQSLQNGEVDIAVYPADQYADNYERLTNVEFLGITDLAYTYIGFQMGTWEDNQNVFDEDKAVSDINLRKAMAYAVDNQGVAENFYDGLRWGANTLLAPSHPDYYDESIEGYTQDIDEANRILDEAGYEDVDGDGFREDPNGEELVLNFASMSGGDTAEPIATYYMQAWEDVGINVQLLDGRLQEFNTFYDRLEAADQEIDVYQGAWGVGSDVDPTGLWGSSAAYNYTRWTDERNDELLAQGVSEEALDIERRQEIYKEWQEYMVEQVPAFPTLYRSELTAVNNRVVNFAPFRASGTEVYLNELGVTADSAETAN
ncbi:oligopeptide ABC transporter substrate-binding protein [Alkalicoccobacillus porphyridii]|uniref:Oligopeptide ABC transporter substrate-binding protein n=1 Tax=Alkalicoccobacillus porphyridii TaxID=2597270 RepID=A0A554A3U0_9BACI|nr:oligopeptide ABC transporter substrate-binding protein [Alkalicoccobacillus porphyridii]TSB48357.1 oligopeptide ABC transporter substrate-binding protein [Alkalicoccobacillus porphyridii]